MKPVSRAEIDRLAHEQYRQQFEKAAQEPVIINVEELITLDAPRDFSWGGVGYRAPPPSYRLGVRLVLTANALRDLRRADVPAEQRRPVIVRAARIVREAVRPVTRLGRIIQALRRCPFASADPVELEGLLRWLVHVGDESSMPPPKKWIAVDVVDGLFNFAREFPTLIGADGYPRSYRHYICGTRHLARLAARVDLRQASALRMAQADKDGWKDWAGELSAASGWE